MNRAAVDEADQCEILKIFELERSSREMYEPWQRNYKNFEEQRKNKGTLSL